jgi:hypothetical protein
LTKGTRCIFLGLDQVFVLLHMSVWELLIHIHSSATFFSTILQMWCVFLFFPFCTNTHCC